MTVILTLVAVAATLPGLLYLTASDPKRRRAFGLQPRGRRLAGLAWVLVFLPGAALLAAGEGAAFVMWLGAATVLGWLIAARAPVSRAAEVRKRDGTAGKRPDMNINSV